jgi:hypothetical protein
MRIPFPRARGAAHYAVLVLAGASSLALACGAPTPPVAIGPACDTARVFALDDTVHRVVHAMLSPADSSDRERLSGAYAELLLHSITNSLVVPRRLSAPRTGEALPPIVVVRNAGAPRARVVVPEPARPFGDGYALATGIVFDLRPDGRIADLTVSGVSSEIALTRALVLAAMSADSVGGLPARPEGPDTGTVRLRLTLDLARRPALVSRPIFVAVLPRSFEALPAPLPSRVPRPDFRPRVSPDEKRRADLRIVVDATGVPLPGSVETVATTDTAWAAAASEALARSRYSPAWLDGCPVKMRVVQPWEHIVE